MSADISAARGVSAPETSEALWATDGLDLSTDESYAADSGLAQPPATAAGSVRRAPQRAVVSWRAPHGRTWRRIVASGKTCRDRYSAAFTITTTLAQRQSRRQDTCPLTPQHSPLCERKLQ